MKSWRKRRAVLAALCVALLGACAREAAPEAAAGPEQAESAIASEIVGVATIADGDTIRIGDRRIRFDGIETPRERAMCGEINASRAATDALRRTIRSSEVRCAISDLPDAHGRDLAHCRVNDIDLNEYMVANGWARDLPVHSNGAYADEEAAARAAERGVWGLECANDPWPRD